MHRIPRRVAPGSRPPAGAQRGGATVTVTVLVAVLTACSAGTGPAPAPTGTSAPSGRSTPATSSPADTSPAPATDATAPDEALPTPDAHSAVGHLAEGFPQDLLPVPDDGEILVSTFAPVGEAGEDGTRPHDVSLNVRTALPVADVAALYRASLTAAGFAEAVGTPTDGLAAESTFTRSSGAELLTVGVLDRDGVRTVTVGGRVVVAG